MSVHKDKRSNTWYVKHLNQTKRGFRYKRDALAYEAQLIVSPEKPSVISFYDLVDEYLDYKKTDVQYTTYLKYKEGIEIVMKPHFPNKGVDVKLKTSSEVSSCFFSVPPPGKMASSWPAG